MFFRALLWQCSAAASKFSCSQERKIQENFEKHWDSYFLSDSLILIVYQSQVNCGLESLYLYMLRSSSFFNLQERNSKMHDLSMRKVLPFLWQICVHYQFSISPSRPNSQSLLETKWWLLSVARWFWLLLLTY